MAEKRIRYTEEMVGYDHPTKDDTLNRLTNEEHSSDGTHNIPNTGLKILDTNDSHYLLISPGSDLTGDRTLTIFTGDGSRGIVIGADTNIVITGKVTAPGGSGNVFIGSNAGDDEVGDNKLYIDNSNTATPLIHGDFAGNILTINGDLVVTGSATATPGDGSVSQAKLKSTTQTQSHDIDSGTSYRFTLTGGQYCFLPTAKGESNQIILGNYGTYTGGALLTSYATSIVLSNKHGSAAQFGYVIHRYIQASGEVYWIFILRDKITKVNIGISACADHPCFGSSQDPEAESHMFGDYDQEKYEIIVINPSPEEVLELEKKTTPTKSVVEVIEESYEVDDTIESDWPSIPVTVGLPNDYEEKQMGEMITPIKKIIPKPSYVRTAKLKLKEEI